MTKWTDEDRAALRAKFKELDDRDEAIEGEASRQHGAVEEIREALCEQHADRVVGRCEVCSLVLIEGDQGFRYDDGPSTCATHSPTWSDHKREQDELIADGIFEDSFEDGPEAAEGARALVLQRIAAGDGDKIHLMEL